MTDISTGPYSPGPTAEAGIPRRPRKIFMVVGLVVAAALAVGLFTSIGTDKTTVKNAAMTVAMIAAKANCLPNPLFVISIGSVGWLKQGPLPHRRRQRALVKIIEFTADRHAMGQPRYPDIGVLQ